MQPEINPHELIEASKKALNDEIKEKDEAEIQGSSLTNNDSTVHCMYLGSLHSSLLMYNCVFFGCTCGGTLIHARS